MDNKQVNPGKIVKIVITGGPCAGKTTLMSKAIQELGERGVKVLLSPRPPPPSSLGCTSPQATSG